MERCSEKSHLPPISWTTLFQETASSQPSPLSCHPRAMSQLKSDTFALVRTARYQGNGFNRNGSSHKERKCSNLSCEAGI